MSDRCESCGQTKPTPVRYVLSPAMVTGLQRLHRAGGGPLTRRSLGLTGVEYSVFHKAAYWSLIRKGEKETWSLTALGRAFVAEGASLPSTVWAVDGQAVSFETDEYVTAAGVLA